MIVPVRCFSCGKPIGSKWTDFVRLTEEENKSVKEALDELNLVRFCCRGAIMSHVETIDTVGKFNN